MKDLYLIKCIDTVHQIFEVAKFNDDIQPTQIYDVDARNLTCDCPGFRNHRSVRENPTAHKHIALVQEFIDDDQPWAVVYYFDDLGNPVFEHLMIEGKHAFDWLKEFE